MSNDKSLNKSSSLLHDGVQLGDSTKNKYMSTTYNIDYTLGDRKDVSFSSLLYLLLWKNSKFVSSKKLICKILTPWIVMIIVGAISFASPTSNINCIDENSNDCPPIYYQKEVSLDLMDGGLSLIADTLCNKDTYYPGYIGFIPHPSLSNNESLYYLLLNEMNNNINLNIGECNDTVNKLNFTDNSLLQFFNTTDEFNNYINSENYGSSDIVNNRWSFIGFLITINNMNEYDYTISINDSNQADTTIIINEFEQNVDTLFNSGSNTYIYNGFLSIQIWIEQSIINIIKNINNNSNNNMPFGYLWNYFIYPSEKQETNRFWVPFKTQFPTVLLFMFMFNIADMINNLILEKVDGTREALKIMGATQSGYWLSWFIWHFVEFTLASIGISIFGKFIGFVFSNSNLLILFFFIWGFSLSQMAMFSLLAVFINNIKLGGFIGGFGFWLINFAFNYILLITSYTAKIWLCLIPNYAFMQGIDYFASLEEKQIGYNWNNINIPTNNDEITLSYIIGMLYIDTIIFMLLTLYCDNVVPSKFGQTKKWNYLCFNLFKRKNRNNLSDSNARLNESNFNQPFYGKNYEKTNVNLKNYTPYFSIRNIIKEFKSNRKIIYAVNGVNLDINKGEVFCLLGHNGAGKTTLISILTGLINTTNGNALINGYELTKDIDIIRKYIGLCPQKDVLWPTMSTREHLWLYAKLKGVDDQDINNEIEKTIIQCGIRDEMNSDMENKQSSKLSGGQKRKLCLAIALIGGSEIVFLDEPTSGMDPQNRRLVWDIIEKEKKNRCIILTTHYMEEADTLGDHIAIMSHGKIQCYGSSLYLKNIYGVGYEFIISVKNIDNKQVIHDEILNNINNSKIISSIGHEIKYQLPFEECSKFSNLFQKLDDNKDKLNINNYGLSMTTLEEVFLKTSSIDNKTDDDEDNNIMNNDKQSQLFEQPTFDLDDRSELNVFYIHIYAVLYKMITWQKRDWNTIFWRILYPPFITFLTVIIMYYSIPRANNNLPTLNLDTSIYYSDSYENIIAISNYSNISLNNNSDFYNDQLWINTYNDQLINNGKLKFGEIELNGSIDTNFTTKGFQMFLNENKGEWDNRVISYGSFFINPLDGNNNIYLGINVSSYHSLPIMTNLFNNWILNTFYSSNIFIKLSNKPMTKTDIEISNENKTQNSVSGMVLVFMLMFGFMLIPLNVMYFIVNEKSVKTKHQQFVSGISVYSYYIGTYIGDLIISIPTLFIIFILILIIPGTDTISGDAYFPTLITAVFFVMSSIPFVYCFSFLFNKPQTAAALGAVVVMFGLVPLFIEFILQSLNGFDYQLPQSLKIILKFIFSSYCTADNLLNYQIKLNFYPGLFDNYYSWNASLESWTIMICQIFIYFLIVFLIEYLKTIHSISLKLGITINESDDINDDDNDIDDDVLNEKNRLMNDNNDDIISLNGLRKVYKNKPKNNIAVKNMWFGVKQNEIFGFLGTNGAGKSSTLSMLVGEIFPSQGNAFINGESIYNQNKIRRFIGYTAQHDALFDKLTGIEHLKFYGLLKGLKGDILNKQINILINALSLNEHKNKKSENYSGGNKRKLSVAIAMIGNPPIIFLDEPSTGMDPMSRRIMWQFILNTMNGRSVILTTHSMEECEALSNKIGIMVNSELKCLGTTQDLKSKFGKGFQVSIIIKYDGDGDGDDINNIINQINEYLNKYFNSQIIEHHNLNLNIRLTEKREKENDNEMEMKYDEETQLSLSKIFKIMEEMKENLPIQSYGVSQSKLETIFLMMAKNEENHNDENHSVSNDITVKNCSGKTGQ